MKQTYSQTKQIKSLSVFGLVCANLTMGIIFLEILVTEAVLIENIYYLLSCFSFWIAINFVLIAQLKEKVIISSKSITLHTVFKRKTIQLEDVKGYKLKDKNIFIIPKNSEKKGISFSDNLVGEEKIINYFKSDKKEQTKRNNWS